MSDLMRVIAKITADFIEEGTATKDYANLANELRQLGFTEAAGRISEISTQEANHAGILASIAEEIMQSNCKCTKQAPIQDAVLNYLFQFAAMGGNNFKQWLYPDPLKDYAINAEVFKAIDAGISKGHSPEEISRSIYKAHS